MLYMCWILYVTTLYQNLVDTVKYQGQYDSKINGCILTPVPPTPPFPVAIFFPSKYFYM